VRPRRSGRQVFYRVDDHHILELLKQALTHVEEHEHEHANSEPRTANREPRAANGERRTANGESRTANREQR
jgi:hypothetical protein